MKKRDENKRLEWLRGIIRDAPLEGPPVLQWVRRAPQGITRPSRSLGVFPSSFNPPTTAHRVLIERARSVEPMHEIILILDRRPLDKRVFGASLEERLSMILTGWQEDPTISVAFTNRGRFVEKLVLLKKAYPNNTTIKFIVGYDTLIRVLDPKYYKDRDDALGRLFGDSRFLVAGRGNASIEEIKELISRTNNRPFSERIIPFEIPHSMANMSSTQARNEIRRGRDIDNCVPSEIASYIERKGLYGKLRQE
jgi:nicotinamide-nucleotide adenylyltransferase